MNGPFVVAQANSGGSSATPIQVLKLIKPQSGHTDILHASFNGTVKVDFTAIANEKITLFHDSKNQSLHVIFADGSQIIIEPFFDSRGTVLANLVFEMGPNLFYSGQEFAQNVPITEDPSVVPAAGDVVLSGGEFHDPSVDPLALTNPLDLLPPEELPGINFITPEAPFLATVSNLLPQVVGSLNVIVEEEQLNSTNIPPGSLAGNGNEDPNDLPANNFDTDPAPSVTQLVSGSLAGLVTGDLPITFQINGAVEGARVKDNAGNDVKSLDEFVTYHILDATHVEGRVFDGETSRPVFLLELNPDGSFTFTLEDQIDHPFHSVDDGTNPPGIFEETLNLDLSTAIVGHDATPDPFTLPTNTFTVGVIDDTPTLGCADGGQGSEQGGEQGGDNSGFELAPAQFAGARHPGEGGNALINGLGGPAGFGEQFALDIGDDNSSGFVDVSSIFPAGMNFFGTTYNGFYINNNGNITFGSPLSTYTPFALTGATGNPIIAPFFADVDTRGAVGTTSPGGTSTGSDRVHLDFDATNGVITITWDDVGYYGAHDNLANAFQLVIYNTGGQNFSFEFRYENIDWTTGDASGGSGGLGGVVARAGWNSGDGTDFFELPQSGNQSAILGLETTSNPGTAQDGNWVFNVVGGEVTPVGGCTTAVAVDEDDLNQFDIGTSTYQGNNDVAPGDDLPAPSPLAVSGDIHVLYGADGPGELLGVQYTGPALTSQGKPVVFVQEGGAWYGRVLDNDPATEGDQPRDVFKFEVNFASQTFTFTLLDNLDHPLTDDPSTSATETSFEDNLLLTFGITVTDFDGDAITSTVSVNVDDDSPTVLQGESASAAVALDESVGNDGSNPGDTLQSNPPGDDTGNPAPSFPLPAAHVDNPVAFGSATISAGVIGGLFSVSPGADGEGSHEYSLVLRGDDGEPTGIGNAFVQTNLSITDFTATGNANQVYVNDTVYLVQVSDHQINGVVAGVDGDINTAGDNQTAFRIVIDPVTGAVTVEQYLAIHHGIAGDTPAAYDDLANMFVPGEGESGGIFVNLNVTDGDGDAATATSADPLQISFQDDGIGVDVALATAGEGSGTAELAGLVLDESIDSDRGPDSDGDGANDDNPPVTEPSYLTSANSLLAIGSTSTPGNADPGTSVAELFTVTKSIGTDGLLDENKAYSLTLTDDGGDAVLAGSGEGVLTNLHVADTAGSPVEGSAAHRAVWLFKVSDTEIVGLVGQDTLGDSSDDFVALRIFLNVTDPADPILTVEQYLPLEHPLAGAGNFDEPIFLNFADIESGGASLSVTLTDTVTDGDHDTATDSESVTLASVGGPEGQSGTSLITFEDDGPAITDGIAAVSHDESSGLQGEDISVASLPDVNTMFDGDPDFAGLGAPFGAAKSASGQVAYIFGTDGPGSISLTDANGQAFNGDSSGLFTTAGHQQIFLFTDSTTPSLVWGLTTDTLAGATAADVAFAFFLDPSDGTLYLAQWQAIYHDGADNLQDGDGNDHNAVVAIDPSLIHLTVTDADGDSITSSAGISVSFADDGPSDPFISGTNTLVHDETPGIDGPDDVAGPLTVFDVVTNPGNDPDVADPLSGVPVIGYAQDLFTSFAGVNFGTDGPGSPSKQFELTLSGNGVYSGVDTTEGNHIDLFLENYSGTKIVVGRVDGGDHNGQAAFAFYIDADTGQISLVQYLSLHHPDAPNNFDEPIHLGSGTLSVTTTFFDGDVDSTSVVTDISSSVVFEDDGPSVFSSGSAIVNLDESIVNPVTTGQEGGTVPAGADDTLLTQPDGISPFGVATTSVAGMLFGSTGADGGTSEYSLQMKGFVNDISQVVLTLATDFFATQPAPGGNPDPNTGDGIPFTPYADNGQIYLIQVDATHIEGHVGNSLGDPLALTISIDGAGQVTFKQYLALYHDGGDNLFDGDGNDFDAALLGTSTLSDGVLAVLTLTDGDGDKASAAVPLSVRIEDDGPTISSATASEILDDEAQSTPVNPGVDANGIVGGPGDDAGALFTTQGDFTFNAGTDGLKAFSVSSLLVGGNPVQAINVDPVTGHGTSEAITLLWTPNPGDAGGTYTGTGAVSGHTIFTLVISPTGHYTFTLLEPLSHPWHDPDSANNGPETEWEDNLALSFGINITDGDNDTASTTLSINVDDDTPDALPAAIEVSNVPADPPTTGELNFAPGADGWGYASLFNNVAPAGLKSGGQDVHYFVDPADPDTLIGYVGATPPNGLGYDPNNTVFTLTVDPSVDTLPTDDGIGGTYTFDLIKPIDAAAAQILEIGGSTAFGSGPSNAQLLTTGTGGTGQELSLLTGWDASALDVANWQSTGVAAVPQAEVNGSTSGWGVVPGNTFNGTDFLRFDFDDVDFTANAFDGLPVNSAEFEFSNYGGGNHTVKYVVHYTDGTFAAGDIAFAGGGTTFNFVAPGTTSIDYVELFANGEGGGPKVDLQKVGVKTEGNDVNLSFDLDLADGDGDVQQVVLAVKVNADDPIELRANLAGTVEEEQLQPSSGTYPITASGNEDIDDLSGNDTDTSPAGFGNVTNVTSGILGVTGGDGTFVYNLALGIEGTQAQKVGGGGLTSEGAAVLYHQVSPGHFIGYVNQGGGGAGFDGGDRVVFALDFTSNVGNYTFTLYDNVDHPTPTSGGPATEETLAINLNDVILVDDEAGQTALVQGSVNIIDDVPVVNLGVSTEFNSSHIATEMDETVQPDGAGIPSYDNYNTGESESAPTAGSNGGADDVAPGAPNVYNRVPVVSTAPAANQAIGHKVTAAGLLDDFFTGFTPLFGADGPAASGGTLNSLKFTLAAPALTNLFATDTGDPALSALTDPQRAIYLVKVDDTHVEGHLAGVDGIGGAVTSDEYVAFRLTLNDTGDPSTSTISVDQFLAIDHDLSDSSDPAVETPSVFDENVVMKLVQGGALGLELDVTAKDGDGDTAFSSATANLASSSSSFLSFDDDGPTAIARSATAGEGQTAASDVVLIIDTSGSMGPAGNGNGGSDPDGPGGFNSRLAMVKAAIQELFNSGAVHSVFIVDFNSNATFHNSGVNGGWFTNLTDAMNAINLLSDNNATDYDAALQAVTSNFTAPPPGGDRLVSMFLSDGQPNESNGTGSVGIDEDDTDVGGIGEESAWINFLSGHGFDASYALGFGGLGNGDKAQLEPIAWTPGETADNPYDADQNGAGGSGTLDPNVIIISDLSSIDGLVNALITSVGGSVAGNVITNATVATNDDASFGTDGHGFVGKLVTDTNHDGVLGAGDDVYTFDGTGISLNGGAVVAGHEKTFTTGFGGKMHFDFLTGAWDYTSPASVPSTFVDHFSFTLVDGDNDRTADTALNITVPKPNEAPVITSLSTGGEPENSPTFNVVYDTNATDGDPGDTITYSLSSGGDNDLFNINSSNGQVTFKVSPNFEAPADAGTNNVYNITVHANDGHGHDVIKAVAITVTDVNEQPSAGPDQIVSIGENVNDTTVIATVAGTDPDVGGGNDGANNFENISYSIVGGSSLFEINNSGQISLIGGQHLDFETATQHVLTVRVTDGPGLFDDAQVTINVTNENDPPVPGNDHIISNWGGTTYSVPEWAFLLNDIDPNGDSIDVSSVTNGVGLTSVGHTLGTGTNGTIEINDNSNGSNGNTFFYTDTDGSLESFTSATVTVDNGNGGNVTGGAGQEILVGDGNGNTFNGLGGMDIILAGGGDDTIVADQSDLVIDGGSGTDTLSVSVNFNDVGDSQITGIEDVLLTAGGLTLVLDQQTEGFNVTGSSGADNITTGSGNDTIAAMAGVDAINSGGGSDTIVENAVVGTSSDSGRVNNAGSGNDTGQDTVTGFDFSNDILRIDATNVNSFTHGIDTTIGTAGGTDSGVASSFTTTTGLINLNHNGTFGDSGDVAVTFASPIGTFDEANFEARLQYHITGSGGGDTITTGQLDDMIDGGAGSDILNGGAGADSVTGGTGEDIIFMDTSDILIDGGSNQNNDLLTVGNRGDVMVVSGTNNFTALGDNYQNIETLSMLNADGSTGNSTVTLDIADVLQMADTGHAGSLGVGYSDRPALRVDGDAGDVVNLDNSTGTWLLATGATGVPAGYTAYSHVTSGGVPTTNEDAYVMVATGVTVNLV